MQTTELPQLNAEQVGLEKTANSALHTASTLQTPFQNPQKTLENVLANIFPKPQEENRLIRARVILGEDVKDVLDENLQIFTTELQYLISSWFDQYEKKVFGGATLREILKGG